MFEFDLTPLASGTRGEDGSSGDDRDEEDIDHFEKPDDKATPVSGRLHTSHALHPLTQDEATTYCSMLAQDNNAEVFIMPTHHITPLGNVKGFRLLLDRDSDCSLLPINRDMFKGSTMVECDPGNRSIHPEVIRLLSDPDMVRGIVLQVLAQIASHTPNTLASLDCMPQSGKTENTEVTLDDYYTGKERSELLLENLIAERIGHHSCTQRSRDSRSWNVDMPSGVGIFHAYVKSRDTGKREHKAFITVSGGCRRASEQFYNLNLDLMGDAKAWELESCEEAFWLRRTSCRSRCHTIKLFTDALKLSVPTAEDIHSFQEGVTIPVPTTDTLSNDLSVTDDGRVAIFNGACDVTSIKNGVLCQQHPSEGIWLFQGSHQSSVGELSNFGGGFGSSELCGAFPTGTVEMFEDSYQTLSTSNHEAVSPQKHVRLNLYKERHCDHVLYYNPLTGLEIKSEDINYDNKPSHMKWDESFINHLTSHGWLREYQILELIPILHALEIQK